MSNYGIDTTKADIWMHLHPRDGMLYCFRADTLKYFLDRFPVARAAAGTGEGYKVPKNWGGMFAVKIDLLTPQDWWLKDTTQRQIAVRGEKEIWRQRYYVFPAVLDYFDLGCDEILIERITDFDAQISGEGDFRAGNVRFELKTERVSSRNIFVQFWEHRHNANMTPSGEYRYTPLAW
jgi:hypothetical protein